jgi:hypothetical protein
MNAPAASPPAARPAGELPVPGPAVDAAIAHLFHAGFLLKLASDGGPEPVAASLGEVADRIDALIQRLRLAAFDAAG